LTVETASVSSTPSGLHSSMSLTILGLSISGNSHVIYVSYVYNCIIVSVPLYWFARWVEL
jgi:hypothetical protein